MKKTSIFEGFIKK